MFEVEVTYYRGHYFDRLESFEEPTLEAACDRLESEAETSVYSPELIGEVIRAEGFFLHEDFERLLIVVVRPTALAAPDLPELANQTKGAADVC
jgi:hypothetical protein